MSMSAWTRDLISSLIGLWIIVGVYIDGWAHVNNVGVEDFFTPWHATFYSGLAAFFAWIGLLMLRGGLSLGTLPFGYRAGALGAAIFAAGGAVDMLWHALLGIEVSIDALLSPPHLVLLTGVLLMATTAWRSQRSISASATVPELISLTTVVAICGFFLNYISPFRWAAPTLDYRAGDDGDVITWIGGIVIFSALFVIPLLWQVRDGRYRAGTLTAFVLGTGVAIVAAMSEGWPKELLFAGVSGAVVGAIVAEVVLVMSPWRTWRYGLPTVMAIAAFTIWSGQLLGYSVAGVVLWPSTLWLGALLFAAGTGAAVGAVAWHPPTPPAPPTEDPIALPADHEAEASAMG